MMADRYDSYRALTKEKTEGVDFEIERRLSSSSVAFIAPHGGGIEFMTAEIADALAGTEDTYYAFKGTTAKGNGDLHVTSTNFDELKCLEAIKDRKAVVAIHGLSDSSSNHEIDIGGRNDAVRDAIASALVNAGFNASVVSSGDHAALSSQNICNRGTERGGVQIELTAALRKRIRDKPQLLRTLVASIRGAIVDDTSSAQ